MAAITDKGHRKQGGFTLIELLIALGAVGIIMPVIVIATSQVIAVNAMSTARMRAINEVQNAIYAISHDVQMEQSMNLGPGQGTPINLAWVEWDNTSNNVTYSLQNDRLQRAYSVNGGQPTTTVVARNINSDNTATNFQIVNGALNFKITVSVKGFKPVTESRSGQIRPRPQ